MSTGRTIDDRDTDSAQHRAVFSRLGEILTRLERIEQKLDIMEQQGRTRQDPRIYNGELTSGERSRAVDRLYRGQ